MTEIPNNIHYTKTHEWVRKEQDGTFTVGISNHAQELLGDIVFVELPESASNLSKGKECGVIESVKAASDLISPMDATVLQVNDALESEPGLVNQDPYGLGWLFRIQAENPADYDTLLNAENYHLVVQEG